MPENPGSLLESWLNERQRKEERKEELGFKIVVVICTVLFVVACTSPIWYRALNGDFAEWSELSKAVTEYELDPDIIEGKLVSVQSDSEGIYVIVEFGNERKVYRSEFFTKDDIGKRIWGEVDYYHGTIRQGGLVSQNEY